MKDWLRHGKWAITAFVTVCAILIFYDTFYQSRALGELLEKTVRVLAPVLYGMAMAYLLASVVNWFERLMLPGINKLRARSQMAPIRGYKGWLRALSILLAWSTVLLALYLLMSVLVPQLLESIKTLIANAETYYNTIYGWGNNLLKDNPKLALRLQQLMDEYRQSADGFLSGLVPKLENVISLVTGGIWNGVWSVVNFAMDMLIGIIVSVYLLATKERGHAQVCKGIYSLLREDHADAAIQGTRKVDAIFSGFIRGKLLDSLIIGILCFIGCSALKMPYTPLISVVVGVTNVIPFFGPFIGAIPSILIILMSSPMDAFIFALLILGIQQLDGNIIGPAILGNSLGLKPIWIIFSVSVGGGLFGLVGMIAGVPAFTVVYTWFKRWTDRRLETKKLNTPEQIKEAEAERQQSKPETVPASEVSDSGSNS